MDQPLGRLKASQPYTVSERLSARLTGAASVQNPVKLIQLARRFWQCYLDMGLGAVLVLAGGLKAEQLLTDPSAGRASGLPHDLLVGVAAFEIAFGSWLLVGLYRHATRWGALAWFTSLAAVALAQALGGAAACSCLGELHTHPWLMFAFDVGAVGGLWMWAPND